MSLFEDSDLNPIRLILHRISSTMSLSPSCTAESGANDCRDDTAAVKLKAIAIVAILVAGVIGVSAPLVGRKRRMMRTDGGAFVLAKAFAAGVILATGFVHMLHDAQAALTNKCLAGFFRRFPVSGFVAMVAALVTLVVDFVGTQFYEKKHREEEVAVRRAAAEGLGVGVGEGEGVSSEITVVVPVGEEGITGEEKMHIVGMYAHGDGHVHGHGGGHGHGHVHEVVVGGGEDGQVSSHVRHVVVSQILELGIVSHSVIIGLSLGVSQNPCTIRPLIAALSFHQFFEGFALGGCISQAQFKNLSATLMACFFAITTPMGIAVGAGVSSVYNAKSPRALIVEGILDSISAGILIYMALVDLIAADFLSSRMSCNVRLQVASYLSLFLGALSMSSLAIWA